MSDNGNGTSIINKPTGGGAIAGMGEKFSPDLFTGTGNFSVPIALPPGRNGFQPDITLGYSSGNGSGIFGLGWNLSIPGVARKTSKGIPLYDDDKDVFILSGAEDLVEITREPLEGGGYKASFRPRTEGLFARIERYNDATNDYWKVWTKDGLISYYGTPGKANTADTYNDPTVCADPQYKSKVFQWYLSKTVDVFGNVIVYTYDRENRLATASPEDPHDFDQIYLSKIEYVDYTVEDELKFLCSVQLHYETRPDPISVYKQGFEIRTTKRVTKIETRTHADNSNTKVKTYHFEYVDKRVEAKELPLDRLPLNGVSILSQVKIEGHDGVVSEWMPPLEFGYSGFEPQHRNFEPITGDDMPPVSLASRDYEMADVFGTGLPDIIQLNGVARYWRNLGDGKYDLPKMMKEIPSGAKLADPQIQLIDANGDGKLDLLYNKPGVNGYYSMKHDGLWDHKTFTRHKYTPSFSLSDPEVKLLDLDGDGITDVLRNGSRLECFLNDPVFGFYKTITVEKKKIKKFPNVSFSDPRIKFADMCGDGLQDIVMIHDGNITYWPNLGYGRWGAAVTMKNSPRFPYQYNPAQILLSDVDGDGCTDLVYVENNKVTLWINQSGESWSEPIVIQGTPPLTDPNALRFTDVKGTGIAGLVWSYEYSVNPGRERMYILDFTKGIKPYVLNEMNNHMGAITRVEYKSSTYYYLKDQHHRRAVQQPDELGVLPNGKRIPWKTTLPFPVQVVSRVEVIDELSYGKLVTEYSYHHGYYDGGEREFRGFGRVHQRDTESFNRYNESSSAEFLKVEKVHYTPPMETISWFHLGPVGAEQGDWEEVYFEDEYWSGDKQLLKRPVEMIDIIKGLPRRARRDAYRALRGNNLRMELYALDGDPNEKKPYTVSENLQGVRLEFAYEQSTTNSQQPYGLEENNKQGSGYIFFAMALASRTTQWERGTDPMTHFSFTEEYDEYGCPQKQISIAVPRGKDASTGGILSLPKVPGVTPGGNYLATMSETSFTHRDNELYLIGRVVKSTSYEVANNGLMSVFELKDQILNEETTNRLLSYSLTYYDGEAFTGLGYGILGNYGVPVRTEMLVMTEADVAGIYNVRPVYIQASESPGTPDWEDEYPLDFRNLPANAGYKFYEEDTVHREGYYCEVERKKFDFHNLSPGKGLMLQTKDSLENITSVVYDEYKFLAVSVIDPLEMHIDAEYDYRSMQVVQITDPNMNRAQYVYSPLGFLVKSYVLGKGSESLGDTDPLKPGIFMEYDFFAFHNSKQPVFVKTTVREHHASDEGTNNNTIVSIQYSDGFGRLLQTRMQAEEVIFGDSIFGDSGLDPLGISDGDAEGEENFDSENINVIVSGWKVYNNKGKVVEKYEPYYDKGFVYRPAFGESEVEEIADLALKQSQRVIMFYDPRGQVIRTVNPDSTEQRVLFGVPKDSYNPFSSNQQLTTSNYYPTPWENYSYDANDLAPLTHSSDTTVPVGHHYTPSSSLIDALGRTVRTVNRNFTYDEEEEMEVLEENVMQYVYDIQGNLLIVKDPYDRNVFEHEYDFSNRSLKTIHIDSGTKYVVMDCLNRPIQSWDEKGALIFNAYDGLGRPMKIWTRDSSEDPVSVPCLKQKMIYGDTAEAALTLMDEPEVFNLKGKLYKHYDEAGLTIIESYDYKGQVPAKIRRVISSEVLLEPLEEMILDGSDPEDLKFAAYRVDWEEIDDTALDPKVYMTSMEYDALGRVIRMLYPEDVDFERKELVTSYNRSGTLTSVMMNGEPFVERIAYNARGQKILTTYGNGMMTRYQYRSDNFRLLRMKTEGYDNSENELLYEKQSGTVKQNFMYEYDLSGNIISITDTTTGCGVAGTDELKRTFEYDALYRLLSATGRETASTGTIPWTDYYRPDNNNASRAYTQHYRYDKLGNIRNLQHVATGGNFTREFNYNGPFVNNKLTSIDIGPNSYAFEYDVSGNMISENMDRHFAYDYADRLKAFYIQASEEEPSLYAQYLYDGSGNRVKKITRSQGGGTKSTVYIDGIFEHILHEGSPESIPNLTIGLWTIGEGSSGEQNMLHVMDGSSRIGTYRVGDTLGDTNHVIRYNLEDHLGSSTLILNDNGSFISSEEYYPFGETSFGSYGRKHYRFCGKEKDEESGLYYYGLRYYNSWTCRFINIDPLAGKYSFYTPYQYAGNHPINFIDLDGAEQSTTQISDAKAAEGQAGDDTGDTEVGTVTANPTVTSDNANGTITSSTDTNYNEYEVASGDTIYSIAKKYGDPSMSINENIQLIKERNNITGNLIKSGQILIIPQPSKEVGDYYPESDTESTTLSDTKVEGEVPKTEPKKAPGIWDPGVGPIKYFFPDYEDPSWAQDGNGPFTSGSIVIEIKIKDGGVGFEYSKEFAETGDGVITPRDGVYKIKLSIKDLYDELKKGGKHKIEGNVAVYMKFQLKGDYWLESDAFKGEISYGVLKVKIDSSGVLKIGIDYNLINNKTDAEKLKDAEKDPFDWKIDTQPTLYKF